jgi:hypothetical protein
MLSSMLDVNTRICGHAVISKHFNERESALAHIDACSPGDTLVFDRGYYSHRLLRTADDAGVRVLFRLRSNAFRGAKAFYHSSKTSTDMNIWSRDGERSSVRLTKYFIEGKKYVCLSNYEATPAQVEKTYAKRWTVETFFRRLKSNLNLEKAHSMSYESYAQEVEARILLDTIVMMTNRTGDPNRTGPEKRASTYFTAADATSAIAHIVAVCEEKGLSRGVTVRVLRKFTRYSNLGTSQCFRKFPN